MKLLPDTHLLLWSAGAPSKLRREARALLADPENELYFSIVSIWEISIKHALGKMDFVHPRLLLNGLMRAGYRQLSITSEHAIAVGTLPLLHRDPFDRLLVSQANVEGLTLLTADRTLARYSGVQRV